MMLAILAYALPWRNRMGHPG